MPLLFAYGINRFFHDVAQIKNWIILKNVGVCCHFIDLDLYYMKTRFRLLKAQYCGIVSLHYRKLPCWYTSFPSSHISHRNGLQTKETTDKQDTQFEWISLWAWDVLFISVSDNCKIFLICPIATKDKTWSQGWNAVKTQLERAVTPLQPALARVVCKQLIDESKAVYRHNIIIVEKMSFRQ